MNRIKSITTLGLAALLLFFSISACKDTRKVTDVQPGNVGTNPYDTLDYGDDNPIDASIDSNSFIGIHKYLFTPKCAQPACHDGSFEPDFRTVQSAYSTLVYREVFKNNASNSFTYRVLPNDTTQSWFWERITTDDPVLGRMPLYDQPLNKRELGYISNWIMGGAKDIFGNVPSQPNGIPQFFGIVAYLPDSGDLRVDRRRGGNPVFPFRVTRGSNVDIWFGLYDDSTLVPFFTHNKIQYSTKPTDFSNAVEYDLTMETNPKNAPAFDGTILPYFLHHTVNTTQFNKGDVVYFRVYVKDGSHPQPTEIPSGGSQFYILSYFSMQIQ